MAQLETVLITGAASGIGQELARWYAPRARRLVLLDRVEPTGTLAELDGSGAQLVGVAADVTDAASLRTAIDGALEGPGRLDRVIHCAGIIAPIVPLEEVDAELFGRVVEVNLNGTFQLAQAVAPHLERGSHLAMIASLGGLISGYRYFAYSASKFGVVGLAGVLRQELAPRGIKVQVICPPEVVTPLIAGELEHPDKAQRRLKMMAGALSVEQAVKEISAGIESGRYMIIPGRQAKVASILSRIFPTRANNAITDLILRSAR